MEFAVERKHNVRVNKVQIVPTKYYLLLLRRSTRYTVVGKLVCLKIILMQQLTIKFTFFGISVEILLRNISYQKFVNFVEETWSI